MAAPAVMSKVTRSGVFTVNFVHMSHLVSHRVSVVNFEHVIVGWDSSASYNRANKNDQKFFINNPISIYLVKVNTSETCSKLAIKTQERRRRRSGVFAINFEQISKIVLVFPL